jgi:hypothetical protein
MGDLRNIEVLANQINSSGDDLRGSPSHYALSFGGLMNGGNPKEMLQGAVLAVKSEIVIVRPRQYDLTQTLFWQSWSEFLLVVLGLTLSMLHGDSMIWLNSLHIIRAMLGCWVVLSLPRTYALLEDMTSEMKSFKEYVKLKATEGSQKAMRPFAYYSIATCFTFILDFVAVVANMQEVDQLDNVEVVNLVITWLFLSED